MTPGIYYDLAEKTYRADKAIGGSVLGCRSAAELQCRLVEKDEPTAEMQFGTAFHSLLLDPVGATKNVVPWEGSVRRGKAWDEFAAVHKGKTILLQDEFARCMTAITAVRYFMEMDNPAAKTVKALLTHPAGRNEVSMFWTDKESLLDCKGRIDRLVGNVVCDVKTTRDSSPQAFQRSALNFGYYQQAAHYLDGLFTLTDGREHQWIWLAVESQPPFSVGVYQLGPIERSYGFKKRRELLSAFTRAQAAGDWTADWSRDVHELGLPTWAVKELLRSEEKEKADDDAEHELVEAAG